MSKRLAALIAAAIVPALTFAGPAHARTQYPYRLIDLGTFGGPSSFLDLPGVPRNSCVPLPPAPAPPRPLPALTGPPDRGISVIPALHAAHYGPTPVPSARH